jgi:glycogen debranching enzyme
MSAKSTGATALPPEFYISATASLQERRPRTLKHGDSFAVFDALGNVLSGEDSSDGIYHKDTRYLSELGILLNGRVPLLLSSTVQANNTVLAVDLTNPDFMADGRLDLPKDTIYLARSKFLWQATCYERIGVRNFDRRSRRIDISVHFAADFADIFEVRGQHRARRGRTDVAVAERAVVFTYRGLDAVVRRTTIHVEPAPARITPTSVVFSLDLPVGGAASLFITVSCDAVAAPPARAFFTGLRDARRALRASTARAAAVTTTNLIFDEVLRRTVADLYMLITDTPQGPFPYAGIPWFSTAFGRDAIITAIEMLWVDPAIAKGVLGFLAATQAKAVQPDADAEPGKILHETRAGEMARLGEVPFAFYYGSIDSTPLFVMLAGLYFERTADRATVTALWPHIEAALAWIDNYGDRDQDGFVEYARGNQSGLANQGWKDSGDSVFHADGADAEGAIALCEVQGYVFAAKRHAAAIAAALGKTARADALRREADALRTAFEAAFWCEDIGTYALALDGSKRACRVRTSNAGQLLFCGIVPEARAAQVADQLLGADFFTGWGIRTLGASEARYNPMSYHNGSVWPHDNALIGLGLARYGLKHHLQRLFAGLFDTAATVELRRLPELFCGFRRVPAKGPTAYPVACSPQAWSCAAPIALLQASLGLELDAAARCVRFRQPRLPGFLDEVVIRALTLGEGNRLDLLLRRYGAEVSVNVLSRTGDAQVVVTL